MPVIALKSQPKITRQLNHSSFLTPSRSRDFEKHDRGIPRDVAIARHHSRAHRLRPSQRENRGKSRVSCLGHRRVAAPADFPRPPTPFLPPSRCPSPTAQFPCCYHFPLGA